MFKKREKGFTLIELMIVVAIIGILAAIAIPRFGQLISKAKEGKTKGNLGSVRSALAICYGDTEAYPTSANYTIFWATMTPAYLDRAVEMEVPALGGTPHTHSKTSNITMLTTAADNGTWGYNNVSGNANHGRFWIDCSGTGSDVVIWSGQ